MTIGIGYFGTNGIVLGSDMELSGVAAKYKGIKDYFKWFSDVTEGPGVIASVFSGVEDDMRRLWEELESRIDAEKKKSVSLQVSDIRKLLDESLNLIIKPKSKFQMLVVISKEGQPPICLRVFEKVSAPAKEWEIIGGGDVELTRYLTSQIQGNLNRYQSALWISHVINIANSFVQGVGQGIRLSVISNGRVGHVDGDVFAGTMKIVDSYVAGLWFGFCNPDVSPEDFKKHLEAFVSKTQDMRSKVPRILGSF